MSNAGSIATKIVAVAVVVMIVAAILAVTLAPPPVTNPDITSNVGLNAGDVFNYTASGNINGTQITGSYQIRYDGPASWSMWPISTTDHNLDHLLDNVRPVTGSMVVPIGEGEFATKFGTKKAVETFEVRDIEEGLAVAIIGYVGVNPNVVYGFAMNSNWFHVLLTLNNTNNDNVKTGNVAAISWHSNTIFSSLPIEGTFNCTGPLKSYDTYNLPRPGHLSFNITGKGVDIYVFSEANMRSMADGGPFAYNAALTKTGAANQSGGAMVPAGLLMLFAGTHGVGEGLYHYAIE